MKLAGALVATVAVSLTACVISSSEHFDDGVCGSGEKLCGAHCVSTHDAAYGCAGATCNPCDLPKASATCTDGQCAILACNAGSANCNDEHGDGCEADIANDPSRCGGCAVACHAPNAVDGCTGGKCSLVACNVRFADCDHDISDGCEADLRVERNCGGCGKACPPTSTCFERTIAGVWSATCVAN